MANGWRAGKSVFRGSLGSPKRNTLADQMSLRIMPHAFCVLAVSALFLSGCAGSSDQQVEEEEEFDSTAVLLRVEIPETKEFTTATGKVWIVRQVPLDSSLVRVSVEARGFAGDNLLVDFGESDPVIAIHQDDVDKDGFEEIYLLTQAVGSGSYGTILGLTSNKDQSVSLISYEGATPYTSKEGEVYAGYMGHDDFAFKNGELTNTFPVYLPDDTNAVPTGGVRRVYYELVNAEALMQLKPVRSERVR